MDLSRCKRSKGFMLSLWVFRQRFHIYTSIKFQLNHIYAKDMSKIPHVKNLREENISGILAGWIYRSINFIFKLLSANQIIR